MELSREDIADVRAAVTACEQLLAGAVTRGSGELTLLHAQVRALLEYPIDASFGEALSRLDDSFPYHQDRGATWIARGDKKFLKRLEKASAAYGQTPDSTIDSVVVALQRIRYVFDTAARLASHARAWKER